MQTIDDALFAQAVGGFWISETGELVPVKTTCGHSETAASTWGTSYYGSYAAGRVRVSFDGRHIVYVSLGLASVTFEALKALSQVLRHGAMPSQTVEIEDEFVGWGVDGRQFHFHDDKGAQHAASWAMREAMIKRLAKAPQPVVA